MKPDPSFRPSADAPTRLRVIVHGEHSQSEPLRQAVRGLRDAEIDVDVRLTFEAGDARRFAAEAARDGRSVFAMGGDGTLHEAVNGLLDASVDAVLGIVPGGTGNDFAGACGLPSDPVEAVRQAMESPRHEIDLVKVDIFGDDPDAPPKTHHLLNVSTAGLGAEVTADAPEAAKRWLGNLAYLIAGVQRARELEAQEISVAGEGLQGKEFAWTGRAFGAAVGNGRRAGGGATLCPNALVDDGLVDLVICPEMPLDQLLPVVGESLIGNLLRRAETATQKVSLDGETDMVQVVYRQLRWVEIDCRRPTQINLDGQPFRGSRFRFEVEPKRLSVLLPSTCPLLRDGS